MGGSLGRRRARGSATKKAGKNQQCASGSCCSMGRSWSSTSSKKPRPKSKPSASKLTCCHPKLTAWKSRVLAFVLQECPTHWHHRKLLCPFAVENGPPTRRVHPCAAFQLPSPLTTHTVNHRRWRVLPTTASSTLLAMRSLCPLPSFVDFRELDFRGMHIHVG